MATNLPDTSTTPSLVSTQYGSNAQLYDELYAFFRDKTSSDSAAQALSQSLITLTTNNNLNPLDIFKEFNKAATNSELKILLIALFNSLRPSTSKIGYQLDITQNLWIQRNIIP